MRYSSRFDGVILPLGLVPSRQRAFPEASAQDPVDDALLRLIKAVGEK
jgi:hypothetical protein